VSQEDSAAGRLALIPAKQVSYSERARLINEAYADYYVPLHVTADQIVRMDQAYDVDLGRSVVACVGANPVGSTLLSRRGARGWIHSVGTLPAWRRSGIARAMLAQVMAAAVETGVGQLTLEVMTQNEPACRLYESLGFRPRRELLTWRRAEDQEPLPVSRFRLVQADPDRLYGTLASWQTARPCWQREIDSLKKLGSALRGYHLSGEGSDARRHGGFLFRDKVDAASACCLVSGSDSGVSIMAVGIRPGSDVPGLGMLLLQALSAVYPGQALSLLNVPADDVLCRVLAALRFTVTMRQFEMAFALA
jgi:ribosomal protein S18 acetylase RimI-like enzyme